LTTEEEKQLAKKLFNECWVLIEKKSRTPVEDAEMLHLAHASRYHWGNVGSEIEKSIGEWQCSRVNSILGNGSAALLHANLSKFWCSNLPVWHFTHASSSEALAFANFVIGNFESATKWKSQAISELVHVNKADARPIKQQIEELPF
jgi:hypothetical protein